MDRTSQSEQPFRSKENVIHLGGLKSKLRKKSSECNSEMLNEGRFSFSQTNPFYSLHGALEQKSLEKPGQDRLEMLMKNLDEVKADCKGIIGPKQTDDGSQEVLPSKARYLESSHIKISSNFTKQSFSPQMRNQGDSQKKEPREQSECTFKDCEMITQTLNKALNRLQELQRQHEKLSQLLEKQSTARMAMENQNRNLKQQMTKKNDLGLFSAERQENQKLLQSRIQSMHTIQVEIADLKDKLETESAMIEQSRVSQVAKSELLEGKSRLQNAVYM